MGLQEHCNLQDQSSHKDCSNGVVEMTDKAWLSQEKNRKVVSNTVT